MNIFVLSTDPIEAASLHADQHLHKMILESAQMVSTAMRARGFNHPGLYKSAYEKHPCTKWVASNNHNIVWLCELALALEQIRTVELNHPEHSSIIPIKIALDYLTSEIPYLSSAAHTPFVFAGPATIAIRSWSITDKYKYFYRQKHQKWLLDRNAPMSYKQRAVPDFMADLLTPSIA